VGTAELVLATAAITATEQYYYPTAIGCPYPRCETLPERSRQQSRASNTEASNTVPTILRGACVPELRQEWTNNHETCAIAGHERAADAVHE
jgi:hypothetical protein